MSFAWTWLFVAACAVAAALVLWSVLVIASDDDQHESWGDQ